MKYTQLEQQVIDDLVRNYSAYEWEAIKKMIGPRTEYHMRSSYGKHSIYKWDFDAQGKRTSTTLLKKADRELAVGMMKLLEESK